MYSLLLLSPGSLPFRSFRHYSTPSSSASAVAVSLAPARLISACYRHRIPIRAPVALSNPSHSYSSDRVAMYCATVVYRFLMYCSIIWKPVSSLAVAAKVFSHLPPVSSFRGRPISRRAIWSWKNPRTLTMQGVATQVSEPKSNNACTTALKGGKEGHSRLPPLPIEDSCRPLPHTHPKYWKEVTISRRCP